MKSAKLKDVEQFLREQGWQPTSEKGKHTKWSKPGHGSLPIPRHTTVSPGVLRDVEKQVGFVPAKWK